jgi:hypothetical protein
MRADRFDPPLFKGGIRNVLFDRADRYSAMAGLLYDAVTFTQAILRADTTADFRESVCGLADFIGFLKTAFCRQAQPVRDVVVKRARGLALGHTTLATTAGLFGCLFAGVFGVNFAKVFATQVRRTLFRHLTFNIGKLQHLLASHAPSSQKSERDAF